MISMEPVLRRGYTFWDQSLFPIDEYFERVRATQAAMRKAGLSALVLFSNQLNPTDVAYLSAGAAGTMLLTLDGDPAIYTGGGGRELPFQRMMTWITELTTAGPSLGDRLDKELKARGVPSGAVGLVNANVLSAANYEALTKSLAGYELKPFDTEMRDLRTRKRPREVTAVRMALSIASDSIEAAEKSFSEGAPTSKAMIEAERSARMNRGRDFRILANIDGDELRPLERVTDSANSPMVMWVGVIYCNYWAEMAVTFPAPSNGEAAGAVAAMAAAAKSGARASDVAQAGLGKLSKASAESALMYGLGNGIGLSLHEWPTISPTSTDTLMEGSLISLRTLARDGDKVSFASAIVQVGASGGTRLEPLQEA